MSDEMNADGQSVEDGEYPEGGNNDGHADQKLWSNNAIREMYEAVQHLLQDHRGAQGGRGRQACAWRGPIGRIRRPDRGRGNEQHRGGEHDRERGNGQDYGRGLDRGRDQGGELGRGLGGGRGRGQGTRRGRNQGAGRGRGQGTGRGRNQGGRQPSYRGRGWGVRQRNSRFGRGYFHRVWSQRGQGRSRNASAIQVFFNTV